MEEQSRTGLTRHVVHTLIIITKDRAYPSLSLTTIQVLCQAVKCGRTCPATSEFWPAAARGRQKQHGLDASGGAMQRLVHFQEHLARGAEVPREG